MIQKTDLRAYATADDLYSQLIIYQAAEDSTILLLEGDSDYAALEQHIDVGACLAVPGHGKTVILGAMKLVDENRMQGVAALVDRDFVGILHPPVESHNLFYTDNSDIDSTIFLLDSPRERVVSNFSNQADRQRHLSSCNVHSSLELAIAIAYPIGVLRWISERDGYGLNLDRFPIESVLLQDCSCIDLQGACLIAVKRTKLATEDLKDTIYTELETAIAEISDRYGYCRGHDLVKALATVMRKKWGGKFSYDVIENALRAAFSFEDLASTKFYKDLERWAQQFGQTIWSATAQT